MNGFELKSFPDNTYSTTAEHAAHMNQVITRAVEGSKRFKAPKAAPAPHPSF